jgi:hypothetical protein
MPLTNFPHDKCSNWRRRRSEAEDGECANKWARRGRATTLEDENSNRNLTNSKYSGKRFTS